MLGVNFFGGVSLFLGINFYFGWVYIVNYFDFIDIYKLKMYLEWKLVYCFNGEWLELQFDFYKVCIWLLGFLFVGKK